MFDFKGLFEFDGGTLANASVYTNEELFYRELGAIFGRCWLFLAHASCVQSPEAFVATYMGVEPVLVWRGRDGRLRAFLNACPRSGRRVCFADDGTSEAFVCSCHGLKFNSEGSAVQDPECRLTEVPRLDLYKGLLFGTLDESAPDLPLYLGDAAWYLDTFLDPREGVTEAIGGVLKSSIDANWKLAMDGSAGAAYWRRCSRHAPVEEAAAAGDRLYQISAGAGGFVGYWSAVDPAAGTNEPPPEIAGRLGPVRARFRPLLGVVFPNLSFHCASGSLRVWHPQAPQSSQVWTYCLVERAAAADEREAVRSRCQWTFGPAGIQTQEDAAVWSEVNRNLRTLRASRMSIAIRQGLGRDRFHEDLPGRLGDAASEINERYFYKNWLQLLVARGWSEVEIGPHEA
ncbi:MAG TPA: SRPBCC family protein [Dehalococcoidia bacterium]|nr:SRPBCC family protein [Dehalococcoidia bacterium]